MKCWEKWPRFAPDGPYLWANPLKFIKLDQDDINNGLKLEHDCFIFPSIAHSDHRWHLKPRHRCQHIGVRGAVSSYSGALSHYGAIRVRSLNTRSLQQRANILIKPQKTAQSRWFPMHWSYLGIKRLTFDPLQQDNSRSCVRFIINQLKSMHMQHLKDK